MSTPNYTSRTTLRNLDYDSLVWWLNQSGADVDNYIALANQYGVSEMQAVEDLAADHMNFYKTADGQYGVISFLDNTQQTVNPLPDSNVTDIKRGTISQMLNRGKDAVTNKLNITKFPVSGKFTDKAGYVIGSVASGIGAVSTGISLGKLIDSTLYNLNPDFWDSIGMSTLDPNTWATITNGDDSVAAGLFNMILGIDPDTGNTQAYIDENAYAYFAYYMAQQGVFNKGGFSPIVDPTGLPAQDIVPIYPYNSYTVTYSDGTYAIYTMLDCLVVVKQSSATYIDILYVSTHSGQIHYKWDAYRSDGTPISSGSGSQYVGSAYEFDGKTVYPGYHRNSMSGVTLAGTLSTNTLNNSNYKYIAWSALYKSSEMSPIEGITDQTDATLPDVSTWNDIQNTLASLKQQYPDLWDDALVWDNVQPDGTNPQLTYIPVPLPNSTSALDLQPVSGTGTQADTQVIPDTALEQLLKVITSIATNPEPLTQTEMENEIPPENPTDTGSGDSPTPVLPTGKASALWSVYHPTQAQVDSFGGWLWSSDFIDQLIRVFQNPMDAVISLRKVFVTPVDAGQTTIHAGFLDSEVPSNYITQQYVYADCGYVDVQEAFGNVFDYTSTHVSLYLPFIGIVTLNTAEVMRSTLHVVYGVDMFTGTCLARVEVQRDGNTVTMYQYSGNASVEYPLSGQRASSFLGGLMAIGGAAAGVATGGGSVALAASAIGGMTQMSSVNVSHSGGFSGNAGAMGIKKPYIIIERPQTKVAKTFPRLAGYPTNYSCKLSDCTNHVVVKHVHVEGINATESELSLIRDVLMAGVIC